MTMNVYAHVAQNTQRKAAGDQCVKPDRPKPIPLPPSRSHFLS
ncbi:hypothetical protein [Streptomyces sp. NPDC093089]